MNLNASANIPLSLQLFTHPWCGDSYPLVSMSLCIFLPFIVGRTCDLLTSRYMKRGGTYSCGYVTLYGKGEDVIKSPNQLTFNCSKGDYPGGPDLTIGPLREDLCLP